MVIRSGRAKVILRNPVPLLQSPLRIRRRPRLPGNLHLSPNPDCYHCGASLRQDIRQRATPFMTQNRGNFIFCINRKPNRSSQSGELLRGVAEQKRVRLKIAALDRDLLTIL